MNKSTKTLAVLIVEDLESDAQLVVHLLKKAGYELVYEQVETAEQMRTTLEKRTWDIVISDYKLPQFDGRAALKLLQAMGRDIPFIVLSGMIGEETAVAMMKAGAHDYLVKGDLARLVPAVERELEQSAIRRERRQAEEALKESEEKYRELVQGLPDAIAIYVDGKIVFANNASVELMRAKNAADLLGRSVIEFVHPDSRELVKNRMLEMIKERKPLPLEEEKFVRFDGTDVNVEVKALPITFEKKPAIQLIVRDITERVQAEEALAESEIKFRWLYEYAPVAYHLLTPDGKITDVNRRWCEVLGYRREEAIGKSIFDFVVDEEKDETKASFEKKKRSKLSFVEGSERNFLTKDGAVRIFKTYDFFVLDRKQNITSVQTTIEDVTERAQAAEALRLSEKKYKTLFDALPESITLLGLNGHIIECNEATAELAGVPKEKLIGRHFTELGALDVKEIPKYLKLFSQLLAEKQESYMEVGIKRGNEHHRLEVFVNLLTVGGQFHAIQVIARDITARKRAEEALKIRESYLTAIIENQPGLVWFKDLDGRFLAVNGSFAISCGKKTPEEVSGKTDLDIWPKELAEKYRADDVEVIKQKKPLHVEESIFDQGQTKWFETFKMPIFNETRQVIGTTGFARDITDRKKAEDEIRQRVMELETLNRISIVLRGVSKQDEMLAIVLDEALAILNTSHGSIQLYNKTTDNLDKTILRGWTAQVAEPPHNSSEGITGKVFTSGETHVSREFASDPETRAASRTQIPPGWGGICLPIRTTQQTLGVMIVSVPSERELNKDEILLLATLSEMIGAALQRMLLHEETAHRAQEFASLYETSAALSTENELNSLLESIVEHACALLGAESSGIYLYDETSGDAEVRMDTAHHLPIGSRLRLGEGMAGRVAQTRQPLRVENYSIWEGRSPKYDNSLTRAVLEVPMLYGGELVGVLTANEVGNSERVFTDADEHLLSLFASQAAGAIHSARLHEETIHRLEHLQALRAVDQAIASSLDMRLTLNILLTHTLSQLGVDAADVLLLHSGSNLLEFTAGHGFRTRRSEGTSVGVGESFAGRAIMEHRTIMALDLKTAEKNPQFGKLWKEEGFSCYWCVPLIAKGEVRGVLEVYRRMAFTPDPEWLEFLETLAGQAAIAIENTQLFENLQHANTDLNLAYNATIEGWSRAMDMRDQETEGHTQRVADLTMAIAKAMGIKDKEILHVRRGALLHDIGKMGIPDYILLKADKLTDEEWAIMRTHPQLARDMLMPIAYLREALDIPYSHHEKWDGTGYPQGLKGQHIPLSARLFAVVDVWDALTSNRPYRKKWTKKKALTYIHEQRGKRFDPQVVDAFVKIIKEK